MIWRTFLYTSKLMQQRMEGKGTFFSFLVTCATVNEKGCDWIPDAIVAWSNLLKSRNTAVSKVIMGNGGFTVACVNLKVFQRGERKQRKHVYSCFLLPCF